MTKSLINNLFPVTCFGVGGNEEIRGIGAEGPDRVPVVDNVAHERDPLDLDQGKAVECVTRCRDGLVVRQLFFPSHDFKFLHEEAEPQADHKETKRRPQGAQERKSV